MKIPTAHQQHNFELSHSLMTKYILNYMCQYSPLYTNCTIVRFYDRKKTNVLGLSVGILELFFWGNDDGEGQKLWRTRKKTMNKKVLYSY